MTSELDMQRAFAQALRRPSLEPQASNESLGARMNIPLGKNTALGVSAGGERWGPKKIVPRGGVEFKYEF